MYFLKAARYKCMYECTEDKQGFLNPFCLALQSLSVSQDGFLCTAEKEC